MDHEKKENGAGARITRKTVYMAIAIVIVAGLGLGAFLGLFDGLTEIFEDEDIIATVNGEVITEEEFNQALEQEKMQYMQQGIDLDSDEMSEMLPELEEQVLETYFIIPILLEQKAEEEGIEVSDEEVEGRYQEYAAQFGGEAQLEEAMENAGITRDDLIEDISRELSIQNYLEYYLESYLADNPEERIDQDNIELSEEEVENRYQQMREEYAQLKELLEEDDPDVPTEQVKMYLEQIEDKYGYLLDEDNFEEIKPQLEEELRQDKAVQKKQEKEQRILMAHIQELQEESDIEINL